MDNEESTPNEFETRKAELREKAEMQDSGQPERSTPESATNQGDSQGQQTDALRAAAGEDAQKNLSPESPSEKSAREIRERDEATGRFVKKQEATGQSPQPQQQQTQQQPATGQDAERLAAKKAKDDERFDRNWQKLQADRQALEEQRRQIAAYEQQLRQMPNPAQQPRFGSQELAQAADDFQSQAEKALEDDDLETYRAKMKLAKDTRAAAQESYQYEQYEAQQMSQQQLVQAWQNTVANVIKDLPQLNDPNDDLSKEVAELLGNDQRFVQYPDGFEVAVAIAQGRLATEENSGLKAEIEKQKQEITRLNGLLSPLGGRDSSGHSASNNLGNLPFEQRKERLRDAADAMI
jgi:hypothetical protein